MQRFYNKNKTYFIFQSLFLIFLVILCLYATGFRSMGAVNAILFGSALSITIAGMLGGLLMGLGISLIALFLLGTALIWSLYVSSTVLLSVKEIIIWMIVIVASSFISGTLHRWVTTLVAENQEMNAKFDDLVTIDEVTGFDNKKRFHFEMEEEYRRSVRTGTPFSLLLIRVQYFTELKRLYGSQETLHLVKSLSDILWAQTRISDRKFRLEEDTFAVILFNTGEDNVHHVINKIEELLKYQALKDGKRAITLTVAFGVAGFSKELNDHTELIRNAFQELEQYTQ